MEPRRENNLKEAPAAPTPEEDIAEHPVWVKLRSAIMLALLPFAEARAAVVLAVDNALAATSP
jgi:hypothetical protein